MPSKLMTPGVYIEEKNAFPGSAVAVETAVPVFIGYTEKAERKGKSLKHVPTKVTSFAEYVEIFGNGYHHKFKIAAGSKPPFNSTALESPAEKFYFYDCIRLFYQNGGSNCYIMSLGTYGGASPEVTKVKLEDFTDESMFKALEKEYEPTLVLMPDVISKYARPKKPEDAVEAYQVYVKVLMHCNTTQSRFGIFDLAQRDDAQTPDAEINEFRNSIGTSFLNYGAAYYPWLKTSIVAASEIDISNLDIQPDGLKTYLQDPKDTKLNDNVSSVIENWKKMLAEAKKVQTSAPDKYEIAIKSLNSNIHQSLLATSPAYGQIMDEIRTRLNLLPPSSAMAGIYTLIDSSRGVWKSPANVSLAMVNAPSINISHNQQESMNVDVVGGKSINVIRPFPGIGTLVWGARTLDGNSQDWRYINVRRTMIMMEQSLKLACRAYVFEPNDSGTWVTMQSMMNNFLFNLWKMGALAGSAPEQAYDVQVGLGKTMTPNDILDGILRVSVKVAVVRPAEFIVITFQQMQQQA